MVPGCRKSFEEGRRTVTDPTTIVLETERLILRRLTMDDLGALARIYADPQVRRYFPEGTLTHEETREELQWIIDVYYGRYGFGLWATIYKETGEFIGRCGLLPWKVIEGKDGDMALTGGGDGTIGPAGIEVEVAYLLAKEYWGRGLGTEAAQAIVDYAFGQLQMTRLICLFDPENQVSRNIAEKVGLTFERNVEIDGEQSPLYSVSKIVN
jgi:[ribosomal protein S5]-alanine N-acetyltransferase